MRLRFTVAQFLIAVTFVSVCLAAIALYVRARTREEVIKVYGSYDAYRLLCDSQEFDLFQVRLPIDMPMHDPIPPSFPDDVTTTHCGRVSAHEARRLRDVLTSPENFTVDYVKDFNFRPTVLLRATVGDDQLDIYVCFNSGMALILVDGQRAGALIIDKVSRELQSILQSACDAVDASSD